VDSVPVVGSDGLPPRVDFGPLFERLALRRYGGLVSLLSAADHPPALGGLDDSIPAARALLSFLAVLADASHAPRSAVDLMQAALDAYAKRAEVVAVDGAPRSSSSSSSSSSAAPVSEHARLDADLAEHLVATADSLRDAAISSQRRVGEALADGALVRESVAVALAQAQAYVRGRDAHMAATLAALRAAQARTQGVLARAREAEQASSRLAEGVSSLRSTRERDRAIFAEAKGDWTGAVAAVRSAAKRLEAELETLAVFEANRAPYLSRGMSSASVLGALASAGSPRTGGGGGLAGVAAAAAAAAANPLASPGAAGLLVSSAHRLASRAKSAVAAKQAEAEKASAAAAAAVAAAVAAAKEAEAAVALEAASAGPSTTERTAAAMKAAVAATPPPPLPMSPPGTGFGSPTGGFGSGGGLPFASPPPPTPSVTYRGARADDLYASIDATASDIRSRGDLFAAALAGVGSGMGPGSGRYAGGTTASSLRLAPGAVHHGPVVGPRGCGWGSPDPEPRAAVCAGGGDPGRRCARLRGLCVVPGQRLPAQPLCRRRGDADPLREHGARAERGDCGQRPGDAVKMEGWWGGWGHVKLAGAVHTHNYQTFAILSSPSESPLRPQTPPLIG
jgi:hypothetical protein